MKFRLSIFRVILNHFFWRDTQTIEKQDRHHIKCFHKLDELTHRLHKLMSSHIITDRHVLFKYLCVWVVNSGVSNSVRAMYSYTLSHTLTQTHSHTHVKWCYVYVYVCVWWYTDFSEKLIVIAYTHIHTRVILIIHVCELWILVYWVLVELCGSYTLSHTHTLIHGSWVVCTLIHSQCT